MLTITITPTMLVFKDLDNRTLEELEENYDIKIHEKGYCFMRGSEKELYKILLKLSYTYDIEIF